MGKIKILFILFSFFLLIVYNTNAAEFMAGNSLTVGKNDTINNDLFTGAGTFEMNGYVNGDLMSAGGTLTSNGNIEKDFIGVGKTIFIGGSVGDDIIIASQKSTIEAEVEGDVIAAGGEIELSKESVINGNVYTYGGTTIIKGHVKGSIKCVGGDIFISGIVEKNANLEASGSIAFLTGARILGDLKYKYAEEIVNLSEKNIVSGNISFEKIREKRKYFSGYKILFELWSLIASIIVGILMIIFLKRNVRGTIILIKRKIFTSFGIGAAVLIGIPILILLLLIFVITIPAGLILLAIYLIIAYICRIYVGILLGNYLLKRPLEGEQKYYLPLILGLIIIAVVSNIPYIDWLVSLIVSILGMGGIAIYLYSTHIEKAKEEVV